MKLNEFISETISQINSGIKDAKTKTGKDIIPFGCWMTENIPHTTTATANNGTKPICKAVSNLEFEVSLSEESKIGSDGGFVVSFGVISMGVKSNDNDKNNSATKVKFTIPIWL
ncbi:MAG: hypothetical protein RR854_00435 [Muribaculaceae bacterium]